MGKPGKEETSLARLTVATPAERPALEGAALSDPVEEEWTTDADDEGSEPDDAERDPMANAFAAILAHPGPSQKGIEAPILLGSKSLAKRKRQEMEAAAAQSKAKSVRQEIQQRARKKISKKGEDPEADVQEKLLQKIATRGVVQLFNAVSKAQKARQEALASGGKPKDSKASKSDFFSELKRDIARVQVSGKRKQEGPEDGKIWDVLKPDFAGLGGKTATKMKDWDKQNGTETGEQISMSESGSEDDDDEGLGVW